MDVLRLGFTPFGGQVAAVAARDRDLELDEHRDPGDETDCDE